MSGSFDITVDDGVETHTSPLIVHIMDFISPKELGGKLKISRRMQSRWSLVVSRMMKRLYT